MNVFENDGSYSGDPCASTSHSGHKGYLDSQWKQWKKINRFYRWCRAKGVYLNVPDWYFLSGSNKTPMGYVETNWSLPRAYQEIIERQNIYDGTWQKTPSMGFMFVPLTQYHGGGEAATIEPLNEHLDHYETASTGTSSGPVCKPVTVVRASTIRKRPKNWSTNGWLSIKNTVRYSTPISSTCAVPTDRTGTASCT